MSPRKTFRVYRAGEEFVCPETGEEFFETDSPFINGDRLDCPCCGEVHEIEKSFSGGRVNQVALKRATNNGFKYVRRDRGAIEYVAGARTSIRRFFSDNYAHTIGDVIFWPSLSKMEDRGTLAHELCHVHQNQRHGPIRFRIKYTIMDWLQGYNRNRYELSARRADRRQRQKDRQARAEQHNRRGTGR